MASPSTFLDDLEIKRRNLENNVVSLRKALQHWQTWEAEYEGFQEEIRGLGEASTFHDLVLELSITGLPYYVRYLIKRN